MIVTVYIDESGTHKDSPFMIMGGYVARLGQWNAFNPKWEKLLKHYGISCFHSTDLWHRKKSEYKGWSDAKGIKFAMDAGKLTEKNTMMGFSIRLDDADYRTYYVADRTKGIHFDSKYGLCFRHCLSFIPHYVREELERDDIEINFILENGDKNFGDAIRVFHQIKQHVPEAGQYFGTCIGGAKKDYYGLQAADAMASFSLKGETFQAKVIDFEGGANTLENARRVTKLRSPLLRVHLDKDNLTGAREGLLSLAKFKKNFGEQRNREIEERKKRSSAA